MELHGHVMLIGKYLNVILADFGVASGPEVISQILLADPAAFRAKEVADSNASRCGDFFNGNHLRLKRTLLYPSTQSLEIPCSNG